MRTALLFVLIVAAVTVSAVPSKLKHVSARVRDAPTQYDSLCQADPKAPAVVPVKRAQTSACMSCVQRVSKDGTKCEWAAQSGVCFGVGGSDYARLKREKVIVSRAGDCNTAYGIK